MQSETQQSYCATDRRAEDASDELRRLALSCRETCLRSLTGGRGEKVVMMDWRPSRQRRFDWRRDGQSQTALELRVSYS